MASTEDLIANLHDGIALNHYTIALTALYLYDYLLTFADEVKYVWGGKKTWVFFLFLANRYIPALYRCWTIFQMTLPGYTQEICNRTAQIHILVHFLCLWIAQAVLTARVYATTLKNVPITACLVLLSTVQLGLGLYHTALVMMTPTVPSQEIPGLRIYFCLVPRFKAWEITNTVFAIPFDVITFAVTIYCAVRQGVAKRSGSGIPNIFRTLMRDGALYFVVIITSPVVSTFAQILGRPVVRAISGIGVHVYVAIMISRLTLSIRKAAVVDEERKSYIRPFLPEILGNNSYSTIQFAPGTVPSMETEATRFDYLSHRSP